MRWNLSILLLLAGHFAHAQDTRTIKLKNQVAEYEPRSFHIVSVTDERPDTEMIGTMHVGLANKKIKINLQDGAAAAINRYLEKDVIQNKTAPAINLHIKQLKVSDSHSGMSQQVMVDVAVSFYLKDQMLIEYTGTASQETMLNASDYIEGLIRKNLNEMLVRFDNWWAQNGKKYDASGKIVPASLKISVVQGDANGDADLIVYSTKRPLTLKDFQGEPDDMSKGAAATYSGIAMAYNFQTQDDQVSVKVTVTPTFSLSKSWCRPQSRNEQTLTHEQRHFDITGLKACELMTTIKNFPFTPAHFEKELEELRQKAIKELAEEQNTYDKETNHSLIKAQQDAWNKKISKALLQQTCY